MSDVSKVAEFMRMPASIDATGKARQAIYDNMKAGTFPKAVRIGPRSIAWHSEDIPAGQKSARQALQGRINTGMYGKSRDYLMHHQSAKHADMKKAHPKTSLFH